MFSYRQTMWLVLLMCTALNPAYAQFARASPGADAVQQPADGTTAASKLLFAHQEFSAYRTGRISEGWDTDYTVNLESPESAKDEIIVNHLNARNRLGQKILAGQVAQAMLDNVKNRGGLIIKPFTVPDKAGPGTGDLTYYATFYYVYPQSNLGDIWLSRIFTSDAGPVGVLYRHVIVGENPSAIDQSIRRWLKENLRSYGAALAALAVPEAPTAPPIPAN